jgi:hypothetical protein
MVGDEGFEPTGARGMGLQPTATLQRCRSPLFYCCFTVSFFFIYSEIPAHSSSVNGLSLWPHAVKSKRLRRITTGRIGPDIIEELEKQ